LQNDFKLISMKGYIRFLFITFCLIAATVNSLYSQSVRVVDFQGFEQEISRQDAQVIVVNFWATWCRPCIRELPVFQQVHDDYDEKNVKVLLVSLDFAEHLEDRVIPFINNRNIEAEVILLDDVDYNSWIDRVDENWQGDIPFTLIISRMNGERFSHFGEISLEELVITIDSILQEKKL
jgi:thiol-disulfide isomerase/thioredoxin